ncbi:MAG: hypothetical protein L0271_12520 [Gemmatimonadetes bacterium]|nr:hypothetical protein [Gemmatimonadota bacterium]
MSRGDLQGVVKTVRRIPFPRANFPEERLPGAVRVLERQFLWFTGQGTAQDVMFAVIARRTMNAWRQDMLTRLGALPVSAGAFGTISAIEAVEARALSTWWPSDRKGFAAAVVDNRTRLALPLLMAQIDPLSASAEGLAGAQQIARVLSLAQSAIARRGPVANPRGAARGANPPAAGAPSGNTAAAGDPTEIATLLALVSVETATDLKGRLEAKLTELVSAETAKDRGALASLGDGQVLELRSHGRDRAHRSRGCVGSRRQRHAADAGGASVAAMREIVATGYSCKLRSSRR